MSASGEVNRTASGKDPFFVSSCCAKMCGGWMDGWMDRMHGSGGYVQGKCSVGRSKNGVVKYFKKMETNVLLDPLARGDLLLSNCYYPCLLKQRR